MLFKKKEYLCLLTGEVYEARSIFEAHKYFKNTYPTKTPYKMPLKQVMTLKRYVKLYCTN